MAPWDPFFFPSAAGSRVPRRRSKAPTVYAVRFILSPLWILKSFAVDAWRCVRARPEPLGLDAERTRREVPLPLCSGSPGHCAEWHCWTLWSSSAGALKDPPEAPNLEGANH